VEIKNSPNPFISTTIFNIQISNKVDYKSASIIIYNLSGKLIEKIEVPVGQFMVEWNRGDQDSGIFLYNIVLDSKLYATKKMIIL